MDHWLELFGAGGYLALESLMPPGAEPLIPHALDDWWKQTVLHETPLDFGYDANRWTGKILAESLEKEFGVTVSDSTVRLHLKNMGLGPQKPAYQDAERDAPEIKSFVDGKFPKAQRLAKKTGADVGFQDESGRGVMTRSGKTGGLRGETPVIEVSPKRGGEPVLLIITADGARRSSVQAGQINGAVFGDVLKPLIPRRERPWLFLVDQATFHSAKPVRDVGRAPRAKPRLFLLPKRPPEMNPDE